jgi:PhoPQ-activated pathogenicity-related protein
VRPSLLCSLAAALLAVPLAGAAPQAAKPAADAIPSELTDYVNAPDNSFSWKLANKTQSDAGDVYTIDLVSQTWHDIKWDHKLQIYVPKGGRPQDTMVLWNQGGTPNAASGLLGLQLATKIKAPVAFLFGIPKQPLFGGKKEDALIAETFVRYLETKDPSWPLLFPMTKSLVRAMDALQAFAKQEWKTEVKDFVVTGASKRGWTTWLTAATGDKRVKAIAPLVIDTLNMPVQMRNQVKAFGKPSEMIRDYTERKLVPVPDTPEAKKLWRMIDPWVYRDRITVPKMIMCGTNDPYWPLDALNTYWDDLKGEKWVMYIPNAGHDLRELDMNGKPELVPERAINSLAAFCHCQVFGKPMPTLTWVCTRSDGQCKLEVNSGYKPKSVHVWTATSETRDFRKSRWVEDGSGGAPFVVKAPAKGYSAFYAICEYEVDGLTFDLATQLEILEAKK